MAAGKPFGRQIFLLVKTAHCCLPGVKLPERHSPSTLGAAARLKLWATGRCRTAGGVLRLPFRRTILQPSCFGHPTPHFWKGQKLPTTWAV